ncbi:MAG: 16S rRNA (adenine(1518)-N(6)/adenine(1519)-N(6))-dimethyltransferase RsmA [Campylobacter sp.]
MIKAKKKFGQNFLIDEKILTKIIESTPDLRTKNVAKVVEIGCGLGDLTAKLLQKFDEICGYEIDEELFEILQNKFQTEILSKKLELNLGDVLGNWGENLRDERYFLVANLPYYVATKIILKAIDDEKCAGMIVMIQKEVAMKFSANCGEKEFSALAIMTNLRGGCKICFDVAPDAFSPPPKVVSSVIKIEKLHEIYGENALFATKTDYENFKNFLKLAFSSPRKKLIKTLTANYSTNALKCAFETLKIDENLRSHQVDIALFIKIFNFLKANNERRD